jgi:hypothetical protein
MNLVPPTYICLDLPEPQASEVMALRRRYCQRLKDFPPEITITGSSGVGAMLPQLHWDRVEPKLEAIAQEWAPIRASLGGMVRFPDTDIFCLSMSDPMPFMALHEALKHSGIAFEESQFPFFPHCTIRMAGPLTDADISALFSLTVPGEFTIAELALYQRTPDDRIVRVWSRPLAGAST